MYAGEPRTPADGSASYRFDLDGSLPEPPPSTDRIHVHSGSIGAGLGPRRFVVRHALATHTDRATISYDINARPAVTGTGPRRGAAGRGDRRRQRPGEVLRRGPRGRLSPRPPRGGSHSAPRSGPAAIVVTRGAAGATFVTSDDAFDVPSLEVSVADTIGAGDPLCAALLEGLWRQGCLGTAHRAALHTASNDLWALGPAGGPRRCRGHGFATWC